MDYDYTLISVIGSAEFLDYYFRTARDFKTGERKNVTSSRQPCLMAYSRMSGII